MKKLIIHILLILGGILMFFPFYQMIATSLMTFSEAYSVPPTLMPSSPDLANYSALLNGQYEFARAILNSLLYTTVMVVINVFVAAISGFCLAKVEFKFKNAYFFMVIALMMVPSQMFILPNYLNMAHLGLLDTFMAVGLPAFYSFYGVFLMRQFFFAIPDELIEAAVIDGYGTFKIFYKIGVPLVKPGLTVFALTTTLYHWNNLLWPMLILKSQDKMLLPVVLADINSSLVIPINVAMAASVLAILPMFIVYLFVEKHLTKVNLALK